MNRQKLESFIIDNENMILNKIPRKEIIKNLLTGSSDPIYFFLKKNKQKIIPPNKINLNSKNIFKIKEQILSKEKTDKDNDLLYKGRFYNNNNSFYFNTKNCQKYSFNVSGEKNISNDELNEINKKTFSSFNKKGKNNEQSSLIYNSCDNIKDKEDFEINRKRNRNKTKLIKNLNFTTKIFDLNIKNNKIFNNTKNSSIKDNKYFKEELNNSRIKSSNNYYHNKIINKEKENK